VDGGAGGSADLTDFWALAIDTANHRPYCGHISDPGFRLRAPGKRHQHSQFQLRGQRSPRPPP